MTPKIGKLLKNRGGSDEKKDYQVTFQKYK